jgi:hypothetical protein
MGSAFAAAGHYAEARPFLEKGWHFLSRFNVDWGYSGFLWDTAEALIAVLRDAGDGAGANQVLAEFRDHVRRYRDAGIVGEDMDYADGIAAYLAGERDTGLALISQAADEGHWLPPPRAFQQAMFQDPGFAPILERQKARQARERAKVLAVVCNNNPYATVWQPTEETCKRYFSAGHH